MKSKLQMMKGLGTPRTLDEAIMQAMSCGPAKEFPERMRAIFEDYLRQRFATMMLMAKNRDEEALLDLLLKSILKR